MHDDEFDESTGDRDRAARRAAKLAARREAKRAAKRERRRAAIVTAALVFVAFAVGYLFGVATPRAGGSRAADDRNVASPSASPSEREPASDASRPSAADAKRDRDAPPASTSSAAPEPGEGRDVASAGGSAPATGEAVSSAPAPTGAGPSQQGSDGERAASASTARTRGDRDAPPTTDRSTETARRPVATSAARETRPERARGIELPPRAPTTVARAADAEAEPVRPGAPPPRATPTRLAPAIAGEPETGDSGGTPARVAVRIAVSEWIAANRMRDLDRLVGLYAPTLSVFGSDRDVARAAVRREKARAIAQTEDLSAGEPTVEVAPGGRTASTRVRLRYVTAGQRPGSGEVIRELGWVRTPDGWRIASERDVAVFR